MNSTIKITTAEGEKDLQQILILQGANHISNISAENHVENGFLTVKHDLPVLIKMAQEIQQVIAKDGDEVIGFALSMIRSFSSLVPILVPMFSLFETIKYRGKFLNEYNYYVMGQICVAKEYRGKGIFDQLYLKHKELFSDQFELCVTEISVRNLKSLKAHLRVGFEVVYSFKDETEEWNIVIWDWKN